MHEANSALLDILVDNSDIIPSFQNRTSTFLNNGLIMLVCAKCGCHSLFLSDISSILTYFMDMYHVLTATNLQVNL